MKNYTITVNGNVYEVTAWPADALTPRILPGIGAVTATLPAAAGAGAACGAAFGAAAGAAFGAGAAAFGAEAAPVKPSSTVTSYTLPFTVIV